MLLIEDDEGHAQLVTRALSDRKSHFEVQWVTSLAEAVTILAGNHFDVMLCDLTLPDSRGTETVTALRRIYPDTPVVILTSWASEQMASAALEQGAQDYLLKDVLINDGCGAQAVERAIRHAIYRQSAAAEVQRLYRQSRHHQKSLQQKNVRLAKLYRIAQTVVENVSHEFRTPLTVIKEYVALLQDGILGRVTRDQGHFLDVVSDRADDLNRMVDDMLDVSKLDAGLLTVRRSQCDIADIVRHVVLPLKRKAALKGVDFTVCIADHLPVAYCDADKAGRTIINLAVNAIKFCRKSGAVSLDVQFDSAAQEIVLRVVDQGPGINEQDLQRLFSRFTQVDVAFADGTKGFGLGLSIAKEMVEMNLGRITVTSRKGSGSCFSFTIPCANPVEISRRFAQRLQRHKLTSTVLLCVIDADYAAPEELNDIEALLYYVMRTNDLVFRVSASKWLALLACDEKGFATFHHRLEKVAQDTNRNRIRKQLPRLNATLEATWNVKGDHEAILADVQRLMHEAPHE